MIIVIDLRGETLEDSIVKESTINFEIEEKTQDRNLMLPEPQLQILE